MESCAGGVIVLAQRLGGRLLLPPLGRRERLLEAADRRAESASCLWQSLGAEHDQSDDEDKEQVCGADEVLDHVWLVLVVRGSGPADVHAPRARLEQGVRSPATCVAIGVDAGDGNDEGPASAGPSLTLSSDGQRMPPEE